MSLPFQPQYPIILQPVGGDLDNQVFTKTKNEFIANYTEHQSIATWYESSSSPLNPVTGQRWKDTSASPSVLRRFNGSTWDVDDLDKMVNTSITSSLGVLTLPTGKNFTANGSETITSITGTLNSIVFIRWNTSRTITYNATSMILQSYSDRITSVGDAGIYEITSAGTREINFFPANISDNPVGTIINVLSKNIPKGYLKANGAAISRTTYSNLINNTFVTIITMGNKTIGSALITNISTTTDMAVGMPIEGVGIPASATITIINSSTSITISSNATTTATSSNFTVFPFGNGDGSTTVNLPDFRGEFIRGYDDGRGVDSGRVFGTLQNPTHTHTVTPVQGSKSYSGGDGQYAANYAVWTTSASSAIPRNIALLACIKY